MSSRFKIQKKHDIEWEDKYYFYSEELDKVISFLQKYDDGYMIHSPQDPHCFNLEGCDEYEIEVSLIEHVLDRINNGTIPDSDLPVDKHELIRFLEACIRNGRKTNGTVFIDVL